MLIIGSPRNCYTFSSTCILSSSLLKKTTHISIIKHFSPCACGRLLSGVKYFLTLIKMYWGSRSSLNSSHFYLITCLNVRRLPLPILLHFQEVLCTTILSPMLISHVHVIPYSVHSRERLKETEGTDLVRCSLWHYHYQLSFAETDHHLNYLVSSLPDRFLQTITILSMSME